MKPGSSKVSFHELRTSRPYLTWGSLGAGAVAAVGALGTLVSWAVSVAKNVETTDSVDAKIALTRAYVDQAKTQVLELMLQNQKNGAIRGKWNESAQAETAMAVAQIPVDACDIRFLDDKKNPMSVLERKACAEYRTNLGKAKAKYERAYADAYALSDRR